MRIKVAIECPPHDYRESGFHYACVRCGKRMDEKPEVTPESEEKKSK